MDRELDDERTKFISRKLTETLCDIGVNERMVKIRRKCILLEESISNLTYALRNEPITQRRFGSQSEGATSIGLNSDSDIVYCFNNDHVIQDWLDWKPGVKNLLMVKDDNTSPGYCLLQRLRDDSPQAATVSPDTDHLIDDKGRILFKNTILHDVFAALGYQVNGPAGTRDDIPGKNDVDKVIAYHCDSWPSEGREWLERQSVGNWPSMELKRLAVSQGCFVVPVSSKLNDLNDVEWRISTSMAERLVMFSLNITQLGCYVMLKMIKNTFFIINGACCITSFMCKCVLFHCIETTSSCFWREDNLFPCIMRCIDRLRECLLGLNCPHYIIRGNNLMAGRINAKQQRELLLVLDKLITVNIDMFLDIETDDLGKRIQMKLGNVLPEFGRILPSIAIEIGVVATEYLNVGYRTSEDYRNVLSVHRHQGLSEASQHVLEGIHRLERQYHTFSDEEREAYQHLNPLLLSLTGSLLAAGSVFTHHTVSSEAIQKLTAGFESDISSSRLKLASAFYCAGDFNRAEITLRELELMYTDSVHPMCACYESGIHLPDAEWCVPIHRNPDLLYKTISYCVGYLRCEEPIIPEELRHELFRFTEEDLQNRNKSDTEWMDLAVVDSLPYLYFLQYKVYKRLGQERSQLKAFINLLQVTQNNPDLAHKETAWNLLGQCYEQDDNSADALWCYEQSLQVRPKNNAANLHKARLLRT